MKKQKLTIYQLAEHFQYELKNAVQNEIVASGEYLIHQSAGTTTSSSAFVRKQDKLEDKYNAACNKRDVAEKNLSNFIDELADKIYTMEVFIEKFTNGKSINR